MSDWSNVCFRCNGPVDEEGLATRSDDALYSVIKGLPDGPRDVNVWLCCRCASIACLGELIRRGKAKVVVIPVVEGDS